MAQRRRNALVSLLSLVLSMTLTGWLTVSANSTQSSGARQVRGGRIEGMAFSGDAGTPLIGVTVWLMPQPEKTEWGPVRTTQTDKLGNFSFDQVNAGRYRLSIGLEGYITRLYPDLQSGDKSNYLELAESQIIAGIRINVQPGGMLSGIVRDENGKTLPGSTVKLIELREIGERYVVVAEAQTDQSGRYHFEKILPNRYLLRAQRVTEDQANQLIEMGYYPNAPSANSATPLAIDPAMLLRDIDITAGHRVRAPVITGVVTDKVTGEPLEGVGVAAEERWRSFRNTKSTADGSYRLEGLLPGRYLLKTEGDKVGDGYIMEVKEISVAGDDAVNFALTPAPLIIATVQYVGRGPHPALNAYSVTLEFNCGNCMTHMNMPYKGKEEVFEFRGLHIVPVRIGAGFATPQYRVAKVLLGNQDITGKWINLGPGEKLTNVRILITDEQELEPKTIDRRPGGAAK